MNNHKAPAIQHNDEDFDRLFGVVCAQAMVVAQAAFDSRIDEDTAVESVRDFAYAMRDFVRFVDGLPAEDRDLPDWDWDAAGEEPQ